MNILIMEKFARFFWIGVSGTLLLLMWLSVLPQLAGAEEAHGSLSPAEVTVSLDALGTELTAVDDVYTVTEDMTLTVDAPGVLANDFLTTAFTLTLNTPPANGSLTLNDDGSFEYAPDENFNGIDGFDYLLQTGDNPVYAYWPFDDDTNPTTDESGNEFSGTLNGDTAFTTAVPITIGTGLALELDGSGDNVTAGGIDLVDNSFTVAFWAKRDQTGLGNQYVVTHGTGRRNQGFHMGFRSNEVFVCAFWANDLTTVNTYTDTANWNHWACTYDVVSNQRTIYLNGQPVASDQPSAAYQGSGTMYLGSLFNNDDYFDGLLDDVQVYLSALSAEQVQALAQGGQPDRLSSLATVTIDVTAVNDPPTAVGESYHTGPGFPFTVPAPGVLANDSDLDGDTLTVTLNTDVITGTLDLRPDGSFIYTPSIDAKNSDMFSYILTDGASNSEVVTTTIDITPATSFPTCTGFENGVLPEFMYTVVTRAGDGSGRVQVSDRFPYSGEYSLLLDTDNRASGDTQQAAVMIINLGGVTDAELSFWVRNFGDEADAPDGVFISDDGGITWANIQPLIGFPDSYRFVKIDLVAAASNAGMTLVDNFHIKFQSEDNFPLTTDGFGFDNICVREAQADVHVEPTELSLREYSDRIQVVTETISIANFGSLPLTWNVTEALTDCTSPADVPWVTAVSANSDLGTGESSELSAVLDVTGLSPGSYNGLLCINSNDPVKPIVPIRLIAEVVSTAGELEIAQPTMALTVALGYSLTSELVIGNVGGADLSFDLWEVDSGGAINASFVSLDTTPATLQAASVTAPFLELDKAQLALAFDGDEVTPEGFDASADSTNNFDIQNSAWVAVDDVPNGRTLFGQVQCPGKNQFYVMGGFDASLSGNLNRVDVYDTVFGRWESLAPHPEQLRGSGVVCYAGYIYTLGGITNGNVPIDGMYVYDIANNSWEAGPDIPRAVLTPAVGVWDNKIYVIGGTNGDAASVTNTVSIYDTVTGEWGTGTPMPTPTTLTGYVQAGPYIYVAGGQNTTTYFDAVQRYDTRTDRWEIGPSLNETRSALTMAVTEAGLYVLGGATDEAIDIGTTEIDFLRHDAWPNGSWVTIAEPFMDELFFNVGGFCTESAANGEIWRIGGFDNTNVYSTAEYLPREACYSQGGDIPWLSTDVTASTVTVSGTQTIAVMFDASGGITQTGVYTAMLRIVHDGVNANQFVPVTMTVVANDLPIATADELTTTEDITLTVAAPGVLINDSDANSDPLTAELTSSTISGSLTFNSDGSFEYVPDTNFCGVDQFTYLVRDSFSAQSNITTTVLHVTCVNDAPSAADDSYTVSDNSTDNQLGVLDNDSDVDGDGLTISAVASPENGTAVISGTLVLYTPEASFVGTDTFTYTMSDGELTNTAMVTVTVNDVNQAPMAVGDSYTIDENSIDNEFAVLDNDSYLDADVLSLTAVSSPVNGTAVISGSVVVYTPLADFTGMDAFTYTVSDGERTDTATVMITVNAVNEAPTAVDDNYTVDANSIDNELAILVNDSDPNGDSLSITAVSSPVNGTAVISGSVVLYTPNANFAGNDSFTYTVSDTGLSSMATVNITVSEVAFTLYLPLVVND